MVAELGFTPDRRDETTVAAERRAADAAALRREHAGYVARQLPARAADVEVAYRDLTGEELRTDPALTPHRAGPRRRSTRDASPAGDA